jgi:GT2 family glycosyltransferase
LRLSVVIPTHDTRELVLKALGAIAPWIAQGAEVIVVDDGSQDGTTDAIRRAHPRVRVLLSPEARGFTVSANEGLAATTGDILLLLNSDTEADPDTLPAMLAAFEADPRLGAAGAILRYPDGSPQWSGGREPSLLWLFGLTSGLPALLGRIRGYRRLRPVGVPAGGRVDWVTGAAMAIRREAWSAVGPLDTQYKFYAQDLDFCLRLKDAGWHVALVPGWHVMHVGGATIGGTNAGSGHSANKDLLLSDLLTWAEKRHGRRHAAKARWLMRTGARIRSGVRLPGDFRP